MITKKVQVTVTVEVTVDDHIRHLGQMYARGLYVTGNFIEGYGPSKEMGISFASGKAGFDVEIVE